MAHHCSMCSLNRVLCSWWNWYKKAAANTEDSPSFIHTPTPRLPSWSKETNWFAQNCKSRQICYCLHYLSTQHRHSRLMRTSGIHLEHTITFVVCSVCSGLSVWSFMIFYSPVLWFRSFVSCPPSFVVFFLGHWYSWVDLWLRSSWEVLSSTFWWYSTKPSIVFFFAHRCSEIVHFYWLFLILDRTLNINTVSFIMLAFYLNDQFCTCVMIKTRPVQSGTVVLE